MTKQSLVKKGITKMSELLDEVAKMTMLGLMLFIVINILMRRLFNNPFIGAYDLVSVLILIAVVLALANCAIQKGHIAIDFLVERFPLWLQKLIDIIMNLASLIFIALFAYHTAKHAYLTAVSGDVTSTLKIPHYPFIYIASLGYLLLCLIILVDLISIVKDVIKR
ncbi:MAG: TRAP transporter small permease [Dethiobacteria bacterium]|jgi:TRAP-type C4-dicarboxylate transport system permease small subunit